MRVEVPGVVRRAVRAVLGARAHRELVHVGLAEHDHAGGLEPGRHGRVVRRPPALEDPAADRRRHALGAQHVLERERHAGERARCSSPRVDPRGLGERALGVDVQEGVHAVVDGGDPVEVGLRHLDGAHLAAAAIGRGGLDGGEPGESRSSQASSSRMRGHAEAAVLGLGRAGEHGLARQRRADDVGAGDVLDRHRVRRRRHVRRVGDLADRGDRAEDDVELPRRGRRARRRRGPAGPAGPGAPPARG